MSQQETIKLSLWDKEPLMKLLAKKLTPVSLGMSFFVCVSLPLCIMAYKYQRGFFDNISWSIPVVFLFPFLAVLGFKHYQEIPKLFDHLLEDIVENAPIEKKMDFYNWLDARFNNYISTTLILVLSLSLAMMFFFEKQSGCKIGWTGWMFGGDLFYLSSEVKEGCGFTGIGLFAAAVQVVIGYWCMNLAFRAAVCYWGLYELFDRKKNWNFQIRVSPLHPDRCCGLGRIGDVAMLFNVIIFIIGIYVSLTVLDKMFVQESTPFADITIPLYLAGYVLLDHSCFFFRLARLAAQ
jgi:hypothetical protein